MFLGLRTTVYKASDLAASKEWFARVLECEPNFDEPFYVGFTVGGFELGLVPMEDGDDRAMSYWGVPDASAAVAELVAAGAAIHSEVTEVGEGIRVAAVRAPGGQVVGVVENPNFVFRDVDTRLTGPGR